MDWFPSIVAGVFMGLGASFMLGARRAARDAGTAASFAARAALASSFGLGVPPGDWASLTKLHPRDAKDTKDEDPTSLDGD